MRIVQVQDRRRGLRVGVVEDGVVRDLSAVEGSAAASTASILGCCETAREAIEWVGDLAAAAEGEWSFEELEAGASPDAGLAPPIDAPEVWAAGVTYERSRVAREAESGAAVFYTKVYEADRPELFLKTSNMLRTVGPHAAIGIRHDSTWTVPEPELAVVFGRDGEAFGYTVGNDVTARDIEGANPLYLAQAKSFRAGCALGPAILLAEEGTDPAAWTIELRIIRAGAPVFEGKVPVSKMRRSVPYLRDYLVMDNHILPGTVLLTGTGLVPPDEVALEAGDIVHITIDPLGTLTNPVERLAAN